MGDDAALNLAQPEHAPELHQLAGLTLTDDRRVWLKQADQLLARGHLLTLEHPPCGLLNHLRHTRDERLTGFVEALGEAVSLLFGALLAVLLHLLSLLNHLRGQVEQLRVALLDVLGRLLATPTRRIDKLLGNLPNAARVVTEQGARTRDAVCKDGLGPANGAGEYAYPIGEQLEMRHLLLVAAEHRQAYEQAIAHGCEILRYDRANERAHRDLMRLYYLSGNRSAALRQSFQAVHIGDEVYWDGLFSQNPPVHEFVSRSAGVEAAQKPDQIWVLHINPQERKHEPTSEVMLDRILALDV